MWDYSYLVTTTSIQMRIISMLWKPCVFDVTTLWTMGNSLWQSQQKYILVCLAKCLQRETLLHFTRQWDSPKPFACLLGMPLKVWVWTLGLGPNVSLVFYIPDIRLCMFSPILCCRAKLSKIDDILINTWIVKKHLSKAVGSVNSDLVIRLSPPGITWSHDGK